MKNELINKTARELGINTGRFKTGYFNAITDVKGIKVGHVTHIQNNVEVPETNEKSCVRSGVTAIDPGFGNNYPRRFVAGGFILNGIGEVTGLTQVMEWGWLETPILLTNTMSIGTVHKGIIKYMRQKYPEVNKNNEIIIPIIGETDDSYLNDVRILSIKTEDVSQALKNAQKGFVKQGSIGAGTGMTTFDFAGGIGSSSRILPEDKGGYTIGVLVLSNVGNMINLTIDGNVIGRKLDPMFKGNRRLDSYGSVIVVTATDAPLLSNQLSRIAKRSALGVGRVGSFASSTSGEIMIAFSTANRVTKEIAGKKKYLTLNFISDKLLDYLYEAVIEATEEAVINSIFCSSGMDGRLGRKCPSVPYKKVLEILKRQR